MHRGTVLDAASGTLYNTGVPKGSHQRAMLTLSHQDWMTLHEVTLDLHAVRNLAALPACIVEGMQRLIRCDTATLQDDHGGLHDIPWIQGAGVSWEPRAGGQLGVRFMADWAVRFETLREAFFAVSAEKHPHAEYYRRTGDRTARRLSKIVPMRVLSQKQFYNEISRPLGVRWQLSFYEPMPQGATLMAAVCRQGMDFSGRDQTLLDLLRPHAAGAWRRAWQRERQSAAAISASHGLGKEVGTVGLRCLGLTTREAEVLDWLSQGKTNEQIGMILGISRSTVKTHVERIFVKLGCETRTAAARTALELPGGY